MTPDASAEAIAEELLEISGEALLSGDLERFRSCFDLPLQIETVVGLRKITTEAEFASVFDSVRAHMYDTDAVDFVRTVISSSFVDADTIASIHVTSEIHKGGVLKRAAYPVRSTIKRFGDAWKITSCFYVILDSANHNAALMDVPDKSADKRRMS